MHQHLHEHKEALFWIWFLLTRKMLMWWKKHVAVFKIFVKAYLNDCSSPLFKLSPKLCPWFRCVHSITLMSNLNIRLLFLQEKHSVLTFKQFNTIKPAISGHSKRKPKIGFQDRLSIIACQKYCRMLQDSILQYVGPTFSCHLSLWTLFCLFLSDRLRQVLLFKGLETWKKKVSPSSPCLMETTCEYLADLCYQ